MDNKPCDIEFKCACGNVTSLLNSEPNVCYACTKCGEVFHTELDDNGELFVVLGCN